MLETDEKRLVQGEGRVLFVRGFLTLKKKIVVENCLPNPQKTGFTLSDVLVPSDVDFNDPETCRSAVGGPKVGDQVLYVDTGISND
jgi:hypothetical protein